MSFTCVSFPVYRWLNIVLVELHGAVQVTASEVKSLPQLSNWFELEFFFLFVLFIHRRDHFDCFFQVIQLAVRLQQLVVRSHVQHSQTANRVHFDYFKEKTNMY